MLRHSDNVEPRLCHKVRHFYPDPHQCLREDGIPKGERDGVLVRLQLGPLYPFSEHRVQG